VIESISEFSETTAPGGDGADIHGEFLASDFSRWTIGTAQISTKSARVEGVRDWFESGVGRILDSRPERLAAQKGCGSSVTGIVISDYLRLGVISKACACI